MPRGAKKSLGRLSVYLSVPSILSCRGFSSTFQHVFFFLSQRKIKMANRQQIKIFNLITPPKAFDFTTQAHLYFFVALDIYIVGPQNTCF